jgi:hypothetical protein
MRNPKSQRQKKAGGHGQTPTPREKEAGRNPRGTATTEKRGEQNQNRYQPTNHIHLTYTQGYLNKNP